MNFNLSFQCERPAIFETLVIKIKAEAYKIYIDDVVVETGVLLMWKASTYSHKEEKV